MIRALLALALMRRFERKRNYVTSGKGRVTRLKVSPGGAYASKSAEKLVVYAAIETPDGVVVAEASCPWAQREVWEKRLIQLVGSLRQ